MAYTNFDTEYDLNETVRLLMAWLSWHENDFQVFANTALLPNAGGVNANVPQVNYHIVTFI